MNVIQNGNDIIVSGIECLDLDLTLDCGQAFRWENRRIPRTAALPADIY